MTKPTVIVFSISLLIVLSSGLKIHFQQNLPQGILQFGDYGLDYSLDSTVDSYPSDPKMEVREVWLCSQETRRGSYYYRKLVGLQLTFGNPQDGTTEVGKLIGTNQQCSADRYSVPSGRYIQSVDIEHSSSGIFGMVFTTDRGDSSSKLGGDGGSASPSSDVFSLDDDELRNYRWVGVQARYRRKSVDGLTFYIREKV